MGLIGDLFDSDSDNDDEPELTVTRGRRIRPIAGEESRKDDRGLGAGLGLGLLSPLSAMSIGELLSEHNLGGDGQVGGQQQKRPQNTGDVSEDQANNPEGREKSRNDLENDDDNADFEADVEGRQARYNRGKGLPANTPYPIDFNQDFNKKDPELSRKSGGLSEDSNTNYDIIDTTEIQNNSDLGRIKGNTLDFKHLGGSKTNFDDNFIGFTLKYMTRNLLKYVASKYTDININIISTITDSILSEDVMNSGFQYIIDKIDNNNNNIIMNGDKMRLNLDNNNDYKKYPRATIPIVVIILYLYMLDKTNDFKININFIDIKIYETILKKIFGIENIEEIQYGLNIIKSIPLELGTAYIKQKQTTRQLLTNVEIQEIKNFIIKINIDYYSRFNSPLKKDLFNYENKTSLYLFELLDTLHTDTTLFQISSKFNSLNQVVSELIENPYLIVQLIGLIYNLTEKNDFRSSDILSKGKIDKLIYYFGTKSIGIIENLNINLLKNMALKPENRGKNNDGMEIIKNNDKTALYKYNNKFYIIFGGTNIKNKNDIITNFMNFGNKDYYNDSEYNERIVKGKEYLDYAIEQSQKLNYQPPTILGYSLGGISAMFLSTLYKNIETNVYAPVISKSKMTVNLMEHLEESNIHFFYNSKDPISQNLNYYNNLNLDLDIHRFNNNKYYNTHNLNQLYN